MRRVIEAPAVDSPDTRRIQSELVVSEATNNTLSTGMMVLILVGVVKGVFISFALMAVCYRYSSKNQSTWKVRARCAGSSQTPVVVNLVIRG